MSVSSRYRALAKSAVLAWFRRQPKKVVATLLAFALAAALIALQAFWASTARADDNPVCLSEAGCVPLDPPHTTRVEVTKNGAVDNGVATDVLTAYAFDQHGNPVRATFELFSTDPALRLATRSITTGADGTVKVGATSLKMGSFPVTARVGTTELAGANLPARLTFVSDVPHADHSTLTVSKSKSAVGHPVEATGVVRDTRNNPVRGVRVEFAVSGSATLSAESCLTGADGSCSVLVHGATAEQVWVSARMDGKGAPVDLKDSPQAVAFSPSGVNAGKSSFAVSVTPTNADPARAVADGRDSWTGTATLRDANGNPVPDRSDVAFSVASTSPDASGTGVAVSKIVNHGDGTYTATFTAKKAAGYSVTATVGGRTLGAAQQFSYTAGPVDPSRSSLHVSTYRAQVGGQVTSTVTAADAFGNPVAGVGVVLTASGAATISGAATAACWTDADGRCSRLLTDSTAERVTVRAAIDSVAVGTPAEVVFEAGALDSIRSQFAVHPTAPDATRVLADGVDSWTGVLVARDARGEVLRDLDPALVAFTAPEGVAVSAPVDRGDGTYTATFTATVAGEPQVGVAYGGLSVRAPLPILFASAQVGETAPRPPTIVASGPGEASGARSSVTVGSERQTAGSSVVVMVSVRDEQGKPIAGLPENWFAVRGSTSGHVDHVTRGRGLQACQAGDAACVAALGEVDRLSSSLAISGWTDLGGGDYAVQAASKSAGTFRVDVAVGGQALPQRPEVTFTAGAVCVSQCAGKAARQTRFELGRPGADTSHDQATARQTVYAHAHDAFGNPVAGAAVVLAGPATITARTDASGTATLTLGAPGTYLGTIDGLTPSGAVIEHHRPSVVDPARSRLTVAPEPRLVGEPVTARVQTNDSSGRPVGGVSVRLAADSRVSFTPSAGCVTAVDGPEPGVCEVELTAKLQGGYRVTASIDAAPIGSAQAVFAAGEVCYTDCTPVDPTHRTRVTSVKDGSAADGADLDEVAVLAYDRFGNPVANVPVTATAITPSLAVFAPTSRTDADGRAILTFVSRTPGPAKAAVVLGDRSRAQSTKVSLAFASGKGDPAHSSASIDQSSLPVGQTATLTVIVRDASDQPTEGAVVSFVAEFAQLSAATCVTGSDGTCQARVTSRVAGRHQIEATIPNEAGAGTTLPGSPIVRFTADAPPEVEPPLPLTVWAHETTTGEQSADEGWPLALAGLVLLTGTAALVAVRRPAQASAGVRPGQDPHAGTRGSTS